MPASTPPTESIRLQYVVDHPVQNALLVRLLLYAIFFAVYFAGIQLFSMIMEEPEMAVTTVVFRFFDDAIYWLPAVILICPLVAHDMMKLSNRFAGPVVILRREMSELMEGRPANPVKLRSGDYWSDMATSFNVIRRELHELRAERDSLAANLASPVQPAASEPTTFDEASDALRRSKQETAAAADSDDVGTHEVEDDDTQLIGQANLPEEQVAAGEPAASVPPTTPATSQSDQPQDDTPEPDSPSPSATAAPAEPNDAPEAMTDTGQEPGLDLQAEIDASIAANASPQPTETQPTETQPTEIQPTETQPTETQPTETQPTETQPTETQPTETQPTETQPAETQPTLAETPAGEAIDADSATPSEKAVEKVNPDAEDASEEAEELDPAAASAEADRIMMEQFGLAETGASPPEPSSTDGTPAAKSDATDTDAAEPATEEETAEQRADDILKSILAESSIEEVYEVGGDDNALGQTASPFAL